MVRHTRVNSARLWAAGHIWWSQESLKHARESLSNCWKRRNFGFTFCFVIVEWKLKEILKYCFFFPPQRTRSGWAANSCLWSVTKWSARIKYTFHLSRLTARYIRFSLLIENNTPPVRPSRCRQEGRLEAILLLDPRYRHANNNNSVLS